MSSTFKSSRTPAVMLASEIQLFPDKTIFIQLAIFLLVLVSLNHFVFKPVLKLIRLRKERTEGERERLKELQEKTEGLVGDYESKMESAKQEGFRIKEGIRREGEAQAQRVIQEAKQASLSQLEKIKKEIERETEGASKQLEKEAEVLSQTLAEKVLGRALGKN